MKFHQLSRDKLARAKDASGLGFWGITDFNTSLFEKNYQRLLSNKNSLLGNMLKGRYYPYNSFDDSYLGFSPSYTWRSILSAKDIMSRGTRWRIVNGEKVRSQVDDWLPDTPGFMPFSHVCVFDREMKLCELIDRDLDTQKKELVHAYFVPSEAHQILSIPISMRQPKDKLIYHHEKDGKRFPKQWD